LAPLFPVRAKDDDDGDGGDDDDNDDESVKLWFVRC